jgi:sulfotransferase family protein
LDALGRRDLDPLLAQPGASVAEFARAFVGVLDRLALDQGKRWWLEKTAGNLDHVREIARLVPDARFINIVREGRQNVASLYDMAQKYPDTWWAKYRDLDRAIERWNATVQRTRRLLDVPEVMVIRYERLVADPAAAMQEVCLFAGLPFSRDMIDRRVETAGTLMTAAEPWKADVLAPMRSAAEDKFNEVFNAEQRAYVESRLERIDF